MCIDQKQKLKSELDTDQHEQIRIGAIPNQNEADLTDHQEQKVGFDGGDCRTWSVARARGVEHAGENQADEEDRQDEYCGDQHRGHQAVLRHGG